MDQLVSLNVPSSQVGTLLIKSQLMINEEPSGEANDNKIGFSINRL
jgi:hypothetical protein